MTRVYVMWMPFCVVYRYGVAWFYLYLAVTYDQVLVFDGGSCVQEHLLIVCELLKANLYEFHKFNRESGGEVYFTMPRLQVWVVVVLFWGHFFSGQTEILRAFMPLTTWWVMTCFSIVLCSPLPSSVWKHFDSCMALVWYIVIWNLRIFWWRATVDVKWKSLILEVVALKQIISAPTFNLAHIGHQRLFWDFLTVKK